MENNELEISLKEKMTKFIISYIISLGLISGPTVLGINLLIYKKYSGLIYFMFAILLGILVLLNLVIYYKSTYKIMSKYQKKATIVISTIFFFIGIGIVYLLAYFKVI